MMLEWFKSFHLPLQKTALNYFFKCKAVGSKRINLHHKATLKSTHQWKACALHRSGSVMFLSEEKDKSLSGRQLITHHWKRFHTFSICLSVGNTRAWNGVSEVWNDRGKGQRSWQDSYASLKNAWEWRCGRLCFFSQRNSSPLCVLVSCFYLFD